MVVDDDDCCRDILASALRMEGYVVITAANGLDAITTIDRMARPPDAIVVDLMMPVMTGWELIQALESRPLVEATSIIVTSASHDPRLDGIDACFLRKPVHLEELLERVAASVAARHASSRAG